MLGFLGIFWMSFLIGFSGALVPGPWLLGDRFTAADVVVGSQLRWGLMSNLIEGRPAITAYVERSYKARK